MNVYDFDKTIYNGDSTVDFYFFCLKNKWTIIFCLPRQVIAFILYKLKIKNKLYLKENFFHFLKKIDNIDNYIIKFWMKNEYKIEGWYLSQRKDSDIIISASPDFLLKPLEKKYEFEVIATKVNKCNGKFESENCYGNEKVKRYKKQFKDKVIDNFYTDSLTDLPMIFLATKGYLVDLKKEQLIEYKK